MLTERATPVRLIEAIVFRFHCCADIVTAAAFHAAALRRAQRQPTERGRILRLATVAIGLGNAVIATIRLLKCADLNIVLIRSAILSAAVILTAHAVETVDTPFRVVVGVLYDIVARRVVRLDEIARQIVRGIVCYAARH